MSENPRDCESTKALESVMPPALLDLISGILWDNITETRVIDVPAGTMHSEQSHVSFSRENDTFRVRVSNPFDEDLIRRAFGFASDQLVEGQIAALGFISKDITRDLIEMTIPRPMLLNRILELEA